MDAQLTRKVSSSPAARPAEPYTRHSVGSHRAGDLFFKSTGNVLGIKGTLGQEEYAFF